jgi:Ca2+-binding RTX toxin-like protein
MASLLGLTALLGAMKCGAGDPPPQGDGGGSGGVTVGSSGCGSPGGFFGKTSARFSAMFAMLLLVLGLAGTAAAQSTVAELEDDTGSGPDPYFVDTPGFSVFYIVITDTGSGTFKIEFWEGGVFGSPISTATGLDITTGYFGTNAVTFTGSSETLDVHIGTNSGDGIYTNGADANIIFGLDGADAINCEDNYDLVFGGDDGDDILTNGGLDVIFGGHRRNYYSGSALNYINSGEGMDLVFGDDCDDLIEAESGADYVEGWGGEFDEIYGQGSCDELYGDEGPIGVGFSFWSGAGGRDFIVGGDDDDLIRGGVYADELFGSEGADAIDGGGGADYIYGEDGNDWLHDNDQTAGDYVEGGDDSDVIYLMDGKSDTGYGQAGFDFFHVDGPTSPFDTTDAGLQSGEFDNFTSAPSGYPSTGDAFFTFSFGTHWMSGMTFIRSCS